MLALYKCGCCGTGLYVAVRLPLWESDCVLRWQWGFFLLFSQRLLFHPLGLLLAVTLWLKKSYYELSDVI